MEVTRYSCPACREAIKVADARLRGGQVVTRCPTCFRELRLFKAICPVFPPIEFHKHLGFPKSVLRYLHDILFLKRNHCSMQPKYLFIYEDTYEGCMKLVTRCEKHKDKLSPPALTASLKGKYVDETMD